ncbi:MAG: bifunctional folylpolyglutamate synthase/dihydrofolate synthase, partial [Candidatus Eisenbacteria bacterium]|nr:bifunctional folylpolyglutamate synthase/dihydrofolate synthase [Candidatus Eisenbacteria bacterium]
APPRAVELALSRDKPLDGMLAPLAALAPGARLIATRTRSERAMEPEVIRVAAERHGFDASIADDVATAAREALADSEGTVLLTGSLFAVGEAMEALGGAPGELL